MKKKHIRILFIILSILILLIFAVNFGINLWLQHRLPDYIQKNSNYAVEYKELKVDVSSGDILATNLKIKTKNTKDHKNIGVDGNVDSLKITRLGLYDAIFNKKIASSNLLLVKPHLHITLPKPGDEKTGKKRNPVTFENINIKDGDITIYRHTKQKYLAVNNLRLKVTDLQLTIHRMHHIRQIKRRLSW